jgi:hypothetical protein
MQEFRQNLSDYMEAAIPLAITRRGETLGFYVPAVQQAEKRPAAALQTAADLFREMIDTPAAAPEERIRGFRVVSKTRRTIR